MGYWLLSFLLREFRKPDNIFAMSVNKGRNSFNCASVI